jgi:hypothetical protein
MTLPLKIATALLQMISGESIPQSKVRDHIMDMMITDGVIKRRLQGRTKAALYVQDRVQLTDYIKNHFGVNDLREYIAGYNNESLTRGKAVEISSNSKLRAIRTFKGFLVNSYDPIHCTLNDEVFVVHPRSGTYTFIHDFENFIVPDDVTIVGIENPENFRFIERQQKYFTNIKVLFVSRYPQGGDLIMWLRNIPNPYVHFGDFDFSGVNVYLTEYKKHLGQRASFFVPNNIDVLIQSFGNRELYDRQFRMRPAVNDIDETNITSIISLIDQYKKGLEQEVLISH